MIPLSLSLNDLSVIRLFVDAAAGGEEAHAHEEKSGEDCNDDRNGEGDHAVAREGVKRTIGKKDKIDTKG